MTHTGTYRSWDHMIQRATNPKNDKAKYYSGRNLQIWTRWRRFENFLADMGERPPGTTLERKNNNFGYFPGNCIWATHKTQQGNRRQCRMFTHQGKTQCLTHWAEELGIKPRTLIQRIASGVPFEIAITARVAKGPSWKQRLAPQ